MKDTLIFAVKTAILVLGMTMIPVFVAGWLAG